MSEIKIGIHTVEIRPHDNAHSLDIAMVGGLQCVVQKGNFESGDKGMFFPQDSILPETLLRHMGFWNEEKGVGYLAGKLGNRVKPMRLRGEMSNGVVAPLTDELRNLILDKSVSDDPDFLWMPIFNYASLLGVEKWEPKIPTSMSGVQMKSPIPLKMWETPRGLSPSTIDSSEEIPRGDLVCVTEKVHGTCFTFAQNRDTGERICTSKGLSEKRLSLVESEKNVYWQMANSPEWKDFISGLEEYLLNVLPVDTAADQWIIVRAEIYGPGVQDLHYSRSDKGAAIFDISVVRWEGAERHLEYELSTPELQLLFTETDYAPFLKDLEAITQKVAPVYLIAQTTYNRELLQAMACDTTHMDSDSDQVMEGVVARSISNPRMIAKFINPDYETRKGGTEYN